MKRPSVWRLFLVFLVFPAVHLRADCVYGLVIDTSGSMRPAIDQAVTGARLLIERSARHERFFLVTFGERAYLYEAVTDEKEKLLGQIDNLVVTGHPSKVLDAVFLAGSEMNKASPPSQCRVLVLITDGDEQLSYHKMDAVLRTLRQQQVKVYVIGFPHIIPKEKGKKAQKEAVKLLERLTKNTGGAAWFPRTDAELTAAVNEIVRRTAGTSGPA